MSIKTCPMHNKFESNTWKQKTCIENTFSFYKHVVMHIVLIKLHLEILQANTSDLSG